MKRAAIAAWSMLSAISLAPEARAWGAFHGGYGGGAHHGAWGGGAYHQGAFGTTGVLYGPSGATAYRRDFVHRTSPLGLTVDEFSGPW